MPAANFHVNRLNHVAWRCRDAEETRAFYEDVLGLPLAHVVREDRVPSTGEESAFAHLFFRMRDGSFVAFFDLGDGQGASDPTTPGWVNHLAMSVGSREELDRARQRLLDAGVKVLGVIDHHWLQSIYFHDPNGLRLELSYQVCGDDVLERFARDAHATLAQWTADKPGAGQ
ncbi:catechol 2,3-dioxygenase-like lactoylglutathione lyase family enzyme [Variovorax boronicumulans]|uniref:Catechol 2,3-dioxygenase-like lactoylglutathione lyase family enzyme n=1 Tax=Variovorax boronicumulans TaxID=436515 RepID=A0AAW8DUJ0_9BURK|nr:VOC family protein [Variovorax boronicumulans]MDP9878008.1 catechol 2,3-dioxygenase-like lactoylglutathione lyase family enzyme [Variovorax boronicumulans]MDP9923291.1 catechol 2,3-dioxygenase-like lactoylglutathione lyase family enzyme [Variovorax boronicumulans]